MFFLEMMMKSIEFLSGHPSQKKKMGILGLASVCVCVMAGCASAPESTVKGPFVATPSGRPDYVERVETGSLFRPHMTSLYSGRTRPNAIGDSLKVDVAESLKASSNLGTDLSRETELNSKGPGSGPNAFFADLLNQNMTASGGIKFNGKGVQTNTNSVQTQIMVTVVNVLANGYLVVAGERSVALQGGGNTLRFSGIVDPRDLNDSNLVSSSNVANARFEVLAAGDVSEVSRRSWLQGVLSRTLAIW